MGAGKLLPERSSGDRRADSSSPAALLAPSDAKEHLAVDKEAQENNWFESHSCRPPLSAGLAADSVAGSQAARGRAAEPSR